MKKILVQKSVSIIGLLATCLSTSTAFAEWNNDSAHNGHNPGYGNFPPEDIEQRLFGHLKPKTEQFQNQSQYAPNKLPWSTPSVNQYTAPAPESYYPPAAYSQPDYSQSGRSQPNYPAENAYQQPYQSPQYQTSPDSGYPPALQESNRHMDFNNPWSNSPSSFTMPWGNNSSNSNMMPWGNNSSSGNMIPWGNDSNNNSNTASRNPWENTDSRSTNFSPPLENQGSKFSMPWGGSNSGFSPWGN